MLHDAREPALGLELEHLAVHALAGQAHAGRALQGEAEPGHREAALGVLVRVRVLPRGLVQVGQHGVDHVAHVRRVAGVRERPREDPQPDPDLRGGQAHAVRGVLRDVHVLDQLADLVVDHLHLGRAPVQHGLAVDGDGTDGGHGAALPGPGCGPAWVGGRGSPQPTAGDITTSALSPGPRPRTRAGRRPWRPAPGGRPARRRVRRACARPASAGSPPPTPTS